MGIGGGLFLIVLGAILVFGITGDNIWWLDLDAIGWILIAAGLAVLTLTLWFWRLRRRRIAKPPPLDEEHGMLPEDRKFTEEHRTEIHPPEQRP
jgi:uncharacterized membrane protein YbhN (UPF0104 family)